MSKNLAYIYYKLGLFNHMVSYLTCFQFTHRDF